MARKGIDKYLEDRRKQLERMTGGSSPVKKKPVEVRKITKTQAAKTRARSVGVSSSSRQRTHKRGPSRRKR